MIVRTKEEYEKEQKRVKMLNEKHKCPSCGSINTKLTFLAYTKEVPTPGILGKLRLSYDTVHTTVFECEECHTRFTVDALDRLY